MKKKMNLEEAWVYALETYTPTMLEAILKVAIANKDTPEKLAARLQNIKSEYDKKLQDALK